MTTLRKFLTQGPLAIHPSALGAEFPLLAGVAYAPFDTPVDGVAVVNVCGPLTYSGFLFDSYRAILARTQAALASDAHTIVLRIDSPGGEVPEAFDTARAIKAAAQASGKRLIAHTSSITASAAYALACGASALYVSDTAIVGSIGVISAICDETAADAALGRVFAVVTSGSRKSDGNPHVQLSEGAITAMQATVDSMAGSFFALVRESRGIDPAPFQAGVFVGADSVSKGLADGVMSWADLLTFAAKRPEQPAAILAERPADMSDDDKDKKPEDATRAALVTASESDDPEKAARAKRALAAYDTEESDDDKGEEKKKEEASAANAALAALASTVTQLTAKLEAMGKESAADKFAALKASRPDIAGPVWEAFAKLPFDTAAAAVAATPKGASPAVAKTERAPLQGGHAAIPAPAERSESDAIALRMGTRRVESTGVAYDQSQGVLMLGTPAQVTK